MNVNPPIEQDLHQQLYPNRDTALCVEVTDLRPNNDAAANPLFFYISCVKHHLISMARPKLLISSKEKAC